MPITIGSNIASLKAQRQLSKGTAELSKTYERLSSGQRINRAADDAAGLAISESLKSDKRVFNQGVRNFNDGISLLNIADGAIENLSNITIRLKELAEQSANGTYSGIQRNAIDKEAQALSKEYTRIVQSTKFNGKNLIDGSLGEGLRVQGGFGISGGIQAGLGGAIGTGTFSPDTAYKMEQSLSTSVSLGDLNGDGILDMVSGGYGVAGGFTTVRLGAGDGTFGSSTSYQAEGAIADSVTLGDLNGDGILDMVSVGFDGYDGRTTVRLGFGNGTFGNAVSYLTDPNGETQSVTLGDVNGDGVLDIVAFGSSDYGGLSVRIGIGNGTFGGAVSYDLEGDSGYAVTLGDLNNDGILDIVGSKFHSAPGVKGITTVKLGLGNGTFGTTTTYQAESTGSYSIALGDLNGDSILDMVSGGRSPGSGAATIRLGNGNGTFGTAFSYAMDQNNTASIALGDVNGDGILDLTSAGNALSQGSTTIRLGNGNGTFGSSVSYQLSSGLGGEIQLGDLNGDGVLDLVAATYSGYTSSLLSINKDGSSPLLPFDLKTLSGGKQALPMFDQKINQLSKQRGQIGAFLSRIQVGINTLQSASENYASADSRIRDADISFESSNLVRLNILQQAASAVLGQANLQPQLALKLLGGR
jgi:flagellin